MLYGTLSAIDLGGLARFGKIRLGKEQVRHVILQVVPVGNLAEHSRQIFVVSKSHFR